VTVGTAVLTEKVYLTDAFSREAVAFIDWQKNVRFACDFAIN